VRSREVECERRAGTESRREGLVCKRAVHRRMRKAAMLANGNISGNTSGKRKGVLLAVSRVYVSTRNLEGMERGFLLLSKVYLSFELRW